MTVPMIGENASLWTVLYVNNRIIVLMLLYFKEV